MLNTTEVFQRIAPPLWVLDRLAQRQAQLPDVPDDVQRWLATWQAIRGDGASVVDGKVADVAKMATERMTK